MSFLVYDGKIDNCFKIQTGKVKKKSGMTAADLISIESIR